MSNNPTPSAGVIDAKEAGRRASEAIAASLKHRYAAEKRFRSYGIAAIVFAMVPLVLKLEAGAESRAPLAAVTNTREPTTIGPAGPPPGRGTFQRRFSPSANDFEWHWEHARSIF